MSSVAFYSLLGRSERFALKLQMAIEDQGDQVQPIAVTVCHNVDFPDLGRILSVNGKKRVSQIRIID